jgi:hypothetical protein
LPGRCFCLDAVAGLRVVRRLAALSLIVPKRKTQRLLASRHPAVCSLVGVPPAEKFRRQIEAG